MKILVADDESEFLDLMNGFFSSRGHQVDRASDGDKAKELATRNHYDAAFLDFTMPGLTGIELIEHVRHRSPEAKTYLITGYAGVDESLVKPLGLTALIFKPLSLESLGKLLKGF